MSKEEEVIPSCGALGSSSSFFGSGLVSVEKKKLSSSEASVSAPDLTEGGTYLAEPLWPSTLSLL